MTFSRLAAWGLGPIPASENLVHEETTRRSKCRPLLFFNPKFVFFVIGIATMKENKEKAVTRSLLPRQGRGKPFLAL